METDRALDEKQAAEFLGLSRISLRKMRCGAAPGIAGIPYYKYSSRAVRYSMADLIEWRDRHRVGGE